MKTLSSAEVVTALEGFLDANPDVELTLRVNHLGDFFAEVRQLGVFLAAAKANNIPNAIQLVFETDTVQSLRKEPS